MKPKLPPHVDEIKDGKVRWKGLDDIDYETLGYVLSCHLIIEHYLDEFLQNNYFDLNWVDAKLTFYQKIVLFSKGRNQEEDIITPSLERLNRLRNKFSHNINYKLTGNDLRPFAQLLKRSYTKEVTIPTDKIEILSMYTYLVCAWLAQAIEITVEGKWAKHSGEAFSKSLKDWAGGAA